MYCVYGDDCQLVQVFETEQQATAYAREWRVKAGYQLAVVKAGEE
jgi:hypothetical protein